LRSKILIVEDESIEAMNFQQSLNFFGYDVVGIASTGEEALQKVAELKPNLILMDIVLKGEMDGIEAAAQIKEDYDIPVVYLTAHPEESAVNRAKLTTPYGYLIKPVNKTDLKNIIELAIYKHQIEDELKRSEENYRSLFENANDSIMIRSEEGLILDANPAACKMFGLKRNEFVGKSLKQLISPRCNHLLPLIKSKIQNQGYYNYEILFLHRDGTEINAEASCRKIIYSHQDAVLCISRDITQRKETEENLEISKKKYQTIFENGGTAITTFENDGTIIMMNSEWERLSGYSREEVEGKMKWMEFVHPDHLEKMIKYHQQRLKDPESAPTKYETVFISKNGKQRTMYMTVTALPGTDKWLASSIDITDLKKAEKTILESEQKYSHLFDSVPVGISISDQNSKVLDVNKAMMEISGYTFEEYKNININNLYVHPEKDRTPLLRELELSGKLLDYEVKLKRKDGSTYCALLNSELIEMDGEKVVITTTRDITDRRKAEEALKESEENLRFITDNMNDVIGQLNVEGIITYFSPSIKQLTGYDPQELVGKGTSDLVHPQDQEKVLNAIQEGILDKKPSTVEYRTKISNGGFIWVESNGKAVYDADGNFKSAVFSVRDISDHKKVELALTESEKSYRELVDNSLVGIYKTNINGDILFANKAMAKLAHLKSVEDFKAQKITQFYKNLKDRDMIIEKLKKSGNVNQQELEMVSATNENINVLISANLSDNTVSGMIIDITDLKKANKALRESEKKYKTLFESNPAYTIHAGLDGSTLDINAAAENVTGLSKNEFVGKHITELEIFPKDDLHMHKDMFSSLLKGEDVAPYESRIYDKNSEIHWVETISTVIKNKDKPDSILIINRDIDKRKKSEEEIQASLKEKEVLLKEIHHRVKNNLQIISSSLDLQEDYVKEDPTAVNVLRESQNRVISMAMIHEMLYQSKDLSHINFYDYIRNLTSNLFHSYGAQVSITTEINVEQINLNIETAIPLGLLITELISNSLKYAFSNKDKGKITVSLTEKDGKFKLIISDNGVGLPKEIDFNTEATLGLRLVNSLVNQLDGTINLDRSQGTKYTITFKELTYNKRI
jgi:PAS domain S-box-containing protein